ncbi:MAG: glycosyltransferase [Bacteroidota bacterium]
MSKGHKFSLISFEKKCSLISSLKRRISISGGINWLPKPYTKKPPVISTIWDIYVMYKASKALFQHDQFQLVHCRSYISALVGLWLKQKYGVKFIFDMRGFWVDERVEGGIWNLKNPLTRIIYGFFKEKEIQFFKNSDYTISLTEAARHVIKKMVPEVNSKIAVIPCCVDSGLFNYKSISIDKVITIKSELSIQNGNLVISYLGSVGTWYMLTEMLQFFKELVLVEPNAVFLFITPEKENVIYSAIEKLNIDKSRIKVVGANREEVPVYLSISNISLFFIKPVFSKVASSPTKLGEIMSMGIPVICNGEIGDLDRIISEDVGVLNSEFNLSGYKKTIEKIGNLLLLDKSKIRDTALDLFSLEQGVSIYDTIYNKLLYQP